jgi:hypothetical protein
MLARLALLALMLPAIALAADAPPDSGKLTVPPPPARPAPATEAPPAAPPVVAVYVAPRVDPSDCRMTCAQTYYFCSAGGEDDGCGQRWSQCVPACSNPAPGPTASAVP